MPLLILYCHVIENDTLFTLEVYIVKTTQQCNASPVQGIVVKC